MPRRKMLPNSVRLYAAFATLSLGLAFVAFVVRMDLYKWFDVNPRMIFLVIGTLGLQGFLVFLLLYLRGNLSVPILDRIVVSADTDIRGTELGSSAFRHLTGDVEAAKRTVGSMQNEIKDLQVRLAAASPEVAAPHERERVLKSLREHVTQTLAAEIENRLQERIRETLYAVSAARTFEVASQRLRTEIASLNRRANVNLLIGVGTTVVAVCLLVYMVLTAANFDTWTSLFSHYIPRLTTVVFIEVFSFFFLRLYRTSLDEVKFYQNELTTFDSQRVALDAANQADNADARNGVIAAIGKTDRNRGNHESKGGVNKKDIKDAADILEALAKAASSVIRSSSSKTEEKHGDGE